MKSRNYYEMLLMNLAGKESPEWGWFKPRKEAYRQLTKLTGQDFGFSVGRWKAWLVANGHIPHDKSALDAHQWNDVVLEPIERILVNLEMEIAPDDIFLYMSKDDAVERLKQITGQDFGYDAAGWRQWLQDNYPRHGGGTWVR